MYDEIVSEVIEELVQYECDGDETIAFYRETTEGGLEKIVSDALKTYTAWLHSVFPTPSDLLKHWEENPSPLSLELIVGDAYDADPSDYSTTIEYIYGCLVCDTENNFAQMFAYELRGDGRGLWELYLDKTHPSLHAFM